MGKTKLVLAGIVLAISSSVCYADNPEIGCCEFNLRSLDLDSSDIEGGHRVGDQENSLKMVCSPLGGQRRAYLYLTLEEDCEVLEGYPKWAGTGLQGTTEGEFVVLWQGSSTQTITAEIAPGCSEKITIDITPKVTTSVAIDFTPGGKFGSIVEKINGVFAKFGSDLAIQASGSVEVKAGNCDKYDDGQHLGGKIEAEGGVGAIFPAFEFDDVEFPTPIPGVELAINGGIDQMGIIATIIGTYDESRPSPGSVSGKIDAGVTPNISLGLELEAGIAELYLEGVFSTRLGIQGEFDIEEKCLRLATGTIGFSNSKCEVSAGVRVETLIDYEKKFFTEEFEFDNFNYNHEFGPIKLICAP